MGILSLGTAHVLQLTIALDLQVNTPALMVLMKAVQVARSQLKIQMGSCFVQALMERSTLLMTHTSNVQRQITPKTSVLLHALRRVVAMAWNTRSLPTQERVCVNCITRPLMVGKIRFGSTGTLTEPSLRLLQAWDSAKVLMIQMRRLKSACLSQTCRRARMSVQ